MTDFLIEMASGLFELFFPKLFEVIGHGLLYVFTLGRVKADDDTAVIIAVVALLLAGLGIWLAIRA